MKHPVGKGVLIWQLDRCGSPQAIAQRAKAAGFKWVAIKFAHSTAQFNEALGLSVVAALKAVGIAVWGWQYVYGTSTTNARREAEAAIHAILRYELDGWLVDPESEYKREGAGDWAITYMITLRSRFPSLPVGLCSFRFPSYHMEFPWPEFLHYCDFHAPQVYWQDAHNPAAQLSMSRAQLLALKELPFIPIGSAFHEHGWAPTVRDLDEFDSEARRMGLPGVGWYCWDGAGMDGNPGFWEAISAHPWPVDYPEPEPQPVEEEEELKTQFIALVEGQNIRSGPGTGHPSLGKLKRGECLAPARELAVKNYREVWARFDIGWVAVVHGGTQYLKAVN